MGKMLEIPECDEADMYSEFSRGRHAAVTWHGPLSILRR